MSIERLGDDARAALVGWIGERPETTIAVGALRSGFGRVSVDGDPMDPAGALVESDLIPGEPQGFGDGAAVLRLLGQATDWRCVEVGDQLAGEIVDDFSHRWGLGRVVIDVVHVLGEPANEFGHPLVRQLTRSEVFELPQVPGDLLPVGSLVAASTEHGRFFGAVDGDVLVGYGGSLAAGSRFADVGVQVAGGYRGGGIATACASSTCGALQSEELVPVWSTSSKNAASLATARKLGFVEVERLRYLVPKR